MVRKIETVRVAFLAGTLVGDGAEKQLVYMVRALRDVGVCVRVYHLRKGEFYESVLRDQEIELCYIGRLENPLLRLALLSAKLREFRPHFIQSSTSWANLYVGLAGRLCRALTIGGMRNSLAHDLEMMKGWTPWLVRVPHALIANSYGAKRETEAFGIDGQRITVLQNVINLEEFDSPPAGREAPISVVHGQVVMAVGRLVRVKRFDRFIDSLAMVRGRFPNVRGVIVGEGPERAALEQRAAAVGLSPECLSFLGRREDVPALLRQAHVLMVTSDQEGVPNVILEAMAAGVPVITTSVGDAGVLVQHGITGYVVPVEAAEQRGECLVKLLESEALRRKFGEAGRRRVEQNHSFEVLGDQLLATYRNIAQVQNRHDLVRLLGEAGKSPRRAGPIRAGSNGAAHDIGYASSSGRAEK
jgi:glycosyltransferase involved in cell wall biosynthesis